MENISESDESSSNVEDELLYLSGPSDKAKDINEDAQVENVNGKPSEPRELSAMHISSSEVVLGWDKPKKGGSNVNHYEIKYRELGVSKTARWITSTTEGSINSLSIASLKGNAAFEFKVRAVDNEGEEGPFCSTPLTINTSTSVANRIKRMASLVNRKSDSHLPVYKLPLETPMQSVNLKYKSRSCSFGQRDVTKPERTIMVVGATGAGKSTLIDGMINYIMDVFWDDDFRFSLIDLTDEEDKKNKDQALSQTEWITCYEIMSVHGSKIAYNLNIIDTPGFGDTRGIARDRAITDQIREFFTSPGELGISSLNAVCFVTQAPLARLTPTQKYVFDSILSIFGSDIASNVYVLITFADGNEPPVIRALEAAKVPFQKSFKFNNSALFANNQNKKKDFGHMFWLMGNSSFGIFFDQLKVIEPKSLRLTTEVLNLRQKLEATIQGLHPQIIEGMHKLNTIKQEQHILENHKEDIQARRNFVDFEDVLEMRKVDLQPGKHVTNCLNCNRTCHSSCIYAHDEDKKHCSVMTNEHCSVCPQKCHWTLHQNNAFRFEVYSVKKKITHEDLKRKFDIASKGARHQSNTVEKARDAFQLLWEKVKTMIKEVRQYINQLDKIALRKNPLSDVDYINILIESEKGDAKHGWEERLKLLNKMKKDAEIIAKSTQENFNPWNTYTF